MSSSRWQRIALRLFSIYFATSALARDGLTPAQRAERSVRALEERGEIKATVGGQRRTLQLAPREIALPVAADAAVQLPAGVTATGGDAARRFGRLETDAKLTDLVLSRSVAASGGTATTNVAPLRLEPVFYEKGRAGELAARYVATSSLLLVGIDRAGAESSATQSGAVVVSPSAADDLWLLTYASAFEMLAAAAELEAAGRQVEPQMARTRSVRTAPNDPLYTQQFYFKNTGQNGGTPGVDLNVEGLWPTSSGTGVTVAVVDDGLELTHPDLAPNVATETALHANILGGGNDPTPPADSNHGTICAGFIAARGNNGLGMTGAAPLARLVGVRLLGGGVTDSQEAAAFGWRTDVVSISSNSWGPNDDAKTVSGPDTATRAALASGATSGRQGRGVLYVVATGNGRDSGDHAGYDGYSGNRHVIAVGATNNQGVQAAFSESGPQVLIAAAGQTSEGEEVQLLATDNIGNRGANKAASPEGDYTTSGTQGTSYSTPQVSGVIALMLEANPLLGWRDVKEILIRTARRTDANDAEWITNGGGFAFNHKYGAGFADATAAVARARNWANLAPESSHTQASTESTAIPDNQAAGASRALAFAPPAPFRVETVEVTVTVTHANRGQLRFELTSPAGTTTVLGMPRAPDTAADLTGWTFSTPRHWGETAAGTWTVKAIDTVANVAGTLGPVQVTLYGAAVPIAPAITTQPQGATITSGQNRTLTVAASGTTPLTYQWYEGTSPSTTTPIAGATGSSYTTPALTQNTSYWVRVSNSAGHVDSATAAITVAVVVQAPSITTHPPARLVAIGTGTTLTVAATGTGPLSYQWKKGDTNLTDGGRISGATTATLSLASAALTDTGTYSVVVSNGGGSTPSNAAALTVIDAGVTHALAGAGYVPGGTVTITQTLTYNTTPMQLRWQMILPAGWSYASGGGSEADGKPAAGATSLLEWSWTAVPPSPVTFTTTLNVPATDTGDKNVTGQAVFQVTAGTLNILGKPDPLVVPPSAHSADTDRNLRISLIELTRVIELYNTRNGPTRTGIYAVQAGTEDGFAPNGTVPETATVTLTRHHSADSTRDGRLSLVELTRVIQLYNYRSGTTRTGQYRVQTAPPTEDGFAPGP